MKLISTLDSILLHDAQKVSDFYNECTGSHTAKLYLGVNTASAVLFCPTLHYTLTELKRQTQNPIFDSLQLLSAITLPATLLGMNSAIKTYIQLSKEIPGKRNLALASSRYVSRKIRFLGFAGTAITFTGARMALATHAQPQGMHHVLDVLAGAYLFATAGLYLLDVDQRPTNKNPARYTSRI